VAVREPRPTSTTGNRVRLIMVKIAFFLSFVLVGGRLVQIQVVDSERYQALAKKQYEDKVELHAKRGSILDRNHRPLVSTVTVISIAVDPRMIGKNAAALAQRLSNVLREPVAGLRAKLSTEGTNFVWIRRGVDSDLAGKLDQSRFPGLIVQEEQKRVYHYDDLAGQLLGFTDLDGVGISGLELQFDKLLRGVNGYEVRMKDGLGRAMPAPDYPHVDAVDGEDLMLTLDLDFQAIAEQALKKGVEETDSESGLVVMLEPETGEILALANYPRLSPERAGKADQALTRNRVVTDMFEPGSVFKIVTATAALEHGLVKPSDRYFAENGKYRVHLPHGKTRTINDTHEYGMITFQEAMELSSNIVMAKVSDKIGSELLYRTARDFGFGTETGVELPGEIRGELKKPTDWSGTTLNTMAYGYEVGVTPLQIAAAYSAVANGGVLYKPTIVRRADSESGQWSRPVTVRRVLSSPTAEVLKSFFVGVVERGTGTGAKIPGITVAGKTGTARKLLDGAYGRTNYTATFAGFFPADKPKVVCVVMLDTRSSHYSGGQASAPIFREIATHVLGLSERFAGEAIAADVPGAVAVPDVRDLDVNRAVQLLAASGFQAEVPPAGDFVVGQSPGPGSRIPSGGSVRLDTAPRVSDGERNFVRVPDLRSLSLRRAMNRLAYHQLTMAVEGSGLIVSQVPRPGEQVKRGALVQVRCRPATELTAFVHQ